MKKLVTILVSVFLLFGLLATPAFAKGHGGAGGRHGGTGTTRTNVSSGQNTSGKNSGICPNNGECIYGDDCPYDCPNDGQPVRDGSGVKRGTTTRGTGCGGGRGSCLR